MGCGRGEAPRLTRSVSTLPCMIVVVCLGAYHLIRRELKGREDRISGYAGAEEPLVLLPLEVMVKPLELRFRYHFDGDRPTNRLDKVC